MTRFRFRIGWMMSEASNVNKQQLRTWIAAPPRGRQWYEWLSSARHRTLRAAAECEPVGEKHQGR